ncbi:hypothetical protein [Deinococcus hopiensis]|uniref:Uncharacterized protein n=1 Tax=Deinococcus hopiensis KR-140 TaxID=695939 RepID=A0A1W1UY67_9DEIO|nr:hypothetical protein [Deinococcus hopiensis]SMB86013.1 hypothetical protein SAMN00790413_03641 [Deinococcus hopiensis KR-140]
MQNASLPTILHAIWTQGPLTTQQIKELTAELQLLERVNAVLTLNRPQVIDQDDSGVDPLYTELHACRKCGCTDDCACDGEWDRVEVGLSSACAGQ